MFFLKSHGPCLKRRNTYTQTSKVFWKQPPIHPTFAMSKDKNNI